MNAQLRKLLADNLKNSPDGMDYAEIVNKTLVYAVKEGFIPPPHVPIGSSRQTVWSRRTGVGYTFPPGWHIAAWAMVQQLKADNLILRGFNGPYPYCPFCLGKGLRRVFIVFRKRCWCVNHPIICYPSGEAPDAKG